MANRMASEGCSDVNADAEQEKFWRFSCGFYAASEVTALCLRLQDEEGWDVNLALFGLWLAAEGRVPDVETLEGAAEFSAVWRAEAVAPLRALRRGLKARAGVDPALGAFRERVKALELEAERLQQRRLEALAPAPDPGSPPPFAAEAERNLATLAALLGAGAALNAALIAAAERWIAASPGPEGRET